MDTKNNILKSQYKIIIDNDAGGDDAMAIFLALLYDKYFNGPEVVALTTGNGNTHEDLVCTNNQKILKVANRQEVPIYRGSKASLKVTPESVIYYGKDGLGDNEEIFTDLVPAKEKDAITALIELSKLYEDKLIVVAIGTLTNIALAVKADSGFIGRLAQLYIGAGHIHDDMYNLPEFNAKMDVEAYHFVVQHATPDKVTIFPYSQTKTYLDIPDKWRTDVLGAIETDIIRAQNKFERISIPKNNRWHSLDPSVAAVVLKPDLVTEYKYSTTSIILHGDRRGMSTHNLVNKDDANVRIVYSINVEKYKQFLLDVFSAELK